MARINNPFYVNLVSPTREETAVTLALLLTACCWSDEDLQNMGKAIGIEGEVRPLIESMGARLDDDWGEMLAKTLAANE